MVIDLALIFASVGFLIGAAALFRAYVPPQQRLVNELRARVEELERDTESLHGRLVKRGKDETLETAREAKKARRDAADTVLAQAQAILEQKKEQPQLELVPTVANMQTAKAALRARLSIGEPL